MVKNNIGTCCICGQCGSLSYEHIPPKSAFNNKNIKLYDITEVFHNKRVKYYQAQKGCGMYSLCEDCNNKTGAWYGSAYAKFVDQGMRYKQAQAQGYIAVPYTIFPLQVFKQIVSCFASINKTIWCQQEPQIKDFLLNPKEKSFPPNIEIYMYMLSNRNTKYLPLAAHMDTSTREVTYVSEWAFPPFGYVCNHDKTNTNNHILNELFPLSSFLQYSYDDYAELYLKIPSKPCNPYYLDFRDGLPDFESYINSKKDELTTGKSS